jgi:hypothetical protein
MWRGTIMAAAVDPAVPLIKTRRLTADAPFTFRSQFIFMKPSLSPGIF